MKLVEFFFWGGGGGVVFVLVFVCFVHLTEFGMSVFSGMEKEINSFILIN